MAGELELSSITIDGVPVPLDGIAADVTIRHGRAAFFDSASASTAQLVLLGVTRAMMRPFRLGSLLVVNATDGATVAARFTGRFTDAALDVDVLTAIAVGRLRTLSGYTVGTVAYPEEKWSSRVTRAFTEAGLMGGANLVSNGTFEATSDPWAGHSGSVVARSSEVAHSGGYSLKVTGDADGGGALLESTVIPPSTAGTLEFFAYAVGPCDCMVLLTDWSGVHMVQHDFRLAGGAWERIVVPFVSKPESWGYWFGFYDFAPGGHVTYLDDVRIAAGDAPVLELQVGPFDPVVIARPAEPVTLAAYLDDLAAMVQAAVADRPDGRILVQALTARTVAGAVALDPAEILYAPAWAQWLPSGNVVTVTYAEPVLEVVGSDAASVALYGPIAAKIETELKNATDAAQVLSNRLSRDSYAHWNLPDAPLLVGRRLPIGQAVTLTELPDAAPYDPWTAIVEGWTDHVTADADGLAWSMDLSLSDPLLSGVTLSWAGVPIRSSYHWDTINPATAWRDALTLDSITHP